MGLISTTEKMQPLGKWLAGFGTFPLGLCLADQPNELLFGVALHYSHKPILAPRMVHFLACKRKKLARNYS